MASLTFGKLISVRTGMAFLLGVLIMLGIFARVWQFGALPLSLNRDEASIAYNAWTIAREGVDEWGVSYPFMFRAFGDYKLPGYIYVSAALFTLLDPSELLVRLPSLIAGLGNIVLVMLIVRRIFPKNNLVSWVAGAVLSISPWAIFYSRVAFEAHLALLFTLAALLLLLKGVKTYWQAALIALLLWCAGVTYNAPLLLTPVIIGSYVLFFHSIVRKRKAVTTFLLLAVIAASAVTASSQYQSYVRKNNTTVFFDQTHAHAFMKARSEAQGFIEWLETNRYTYYSSLVVKQYLATIGPEFVLQGGGHPWHSVPQTGHLTLVLYLGAALGLVIWVFSKKKNPAMSFVLLILLATPLPSAITVDAPHATRSLAFFTLSIIPFAYLIQVAIERRRSWVVLLMLLALLIEGGRYTWMYHTQFSQKHSESLQVGLGEAIRQVPETADSIIVQDVDWSGYIYVVLYERMSAQEFQSSVTYGPQDSVGYDTVEQLGRYTFTHEYNQTELNALTIARNDKGTFELYGN